MMRSPKYEVPFFNAETGARRVVVVELLPHELDDALRHLAWRGPTGCGGVDGPISKGYALRRACERVPQGFTDLDVVIDEIRRRPQPVLTVVGTA